VEYLDLLGGQIPVDFYGITKEEMKRFQLDDPEITMAIRRIMELENTLLSLKSPQDAY
jgi:ribosomal protein L25 (general stress protein Ctc)